MPRNTAATVLTAVRAVHVNVRTPSRVFRQLANKIDRQTLLIAAPTRATLIYVWTALGQEDSLMPGVIVPMMLLGLSFAVPCHDRTDEGRAPGINDAASRIAQLAGWH